MIRLPKAAYRPGDLIQGEVWINAPTPIPTSGIVLTVVGTEETDFEVSQEEEDVMTRHQKTTKCRGINTFYSTEATLHSAGSLQAGQWSYAFKLQLPSPLLPSFYSSKGGQNTGIIAYKAIATVRDVSDTNKMGAGVLQGEREILIMSPSTPTAPPVQAGKASKTEEYVSCGCLKKGSISVELSLPDGKQYDQGDVVVAEIRAKNNTAQDFDTIKLLLKRMIKYKTGQVSAYGDAGEKVFRNVGNAATATAPSGLSAGQSIGYGEDGSDGTSAPLTLQVNISKDAPLSISNAKLIQCMYLAEVRIESSRGDGGGGAGGVKGASATVPITVNSTDDPSLFQEVELQVPKGFQPTSVGDVVTFTL